MTEALSRPRPRPEPERSRWSLSLGRVAGIDVRVHASFAILLVLVLLGAGQVDGGVPAAVLWLVLIFLCVLLHELAHSTLARRRGIEVVEILLLPIGGVSRMERLPESARDELAIAIVGPLASIGLAVVAGGVALLHGDDLLPPTIVVGALATRLFWFNLLIGGFNLLPAFPMDGGRVLRSLLETRMDLEQATHRAARLGRVVAVVLVGVGLLFNIWLVVIAVFVFLGGTAEEAATVLHLRLEGHTVGDLMRSVPRYLSVEQLVARSPVALRPDDAVTEDVLEVLRHAPAKTVVVVDRGEAVGILVLDDVVHLLDEPAPRPRGSAPPPRPPLPPPPPPPTAHQTWRHRHRRRAPR